MMVKSGPKMRAVSLASALLVTVAGCSGGADGEGANGAGSGGDGGADKPFDGETVNFVVPYKPGGGYDTYTRMIAPYLGDCLGAQIVVLNEPGAGSLLATNKTAKAAPDGTRIQIFDMIGVLAAQIAGAEGATFDLGEFSWVGRVAAPPLAVVVDGDGDVKDFQDLVDASEVQFVATGLGGTEYIAAAVLAEAYDIPSTISTGFDGAPEATNTVVRGDADAHVMPFDSVVSVITSGDASAGVVLAEELPEYMPEAPLIAEFPAEGDGQELVDQLMTLADAGRAVGAPPGVPEDRLAALREGFTCAMEDQELLDQLASQERPVNVMEGGEYAGLVEKALDPSDDFRRIVEESF
jgi:tripartite-type tricarboxylate transporter receptor subunit TctC